VERGEALAYRTELALTLQDPDRATELLAELDGIALSPRDRGHPAACENGGWAANIDPGFGDERECVSYFASK
jgi:hypothetical protein